MGDSGRGPVTWRAGDFARAAALAVVYAITTQVGRHLIIPEVFVAPVRLSMGVASFALVVSSVTTWPLYLAALLPAHLFLRNPANGFSIALEYFAANGYSFPSCRGCRPQTGRARSPSHTAEPNCSPASAPPWAAARGRRPRRIDNAAFDVVRASR